MEKSNGHIDNITTVKSASTGNFHPAAVIHNYVPERTTHSRIDVVDNNNLDSNDHNDDHVDVVPQAPPIEDVSGCVHYKRRAKFVVSY